MKIAPIHPLSIGTRHALVLVFIFALSISAIQTANAQTETVLYSFANQADGNWPNGGLVQDAQGNLYGTTSEGGSFTNCKLGCGVVFKITPDGIEEVLHTFTGGVDGASPEAGLLRDSKNNLYGTTAFGGSIHPSCPHGCGVVFKLTPDGTETVLHAFTDGTDGAYPESSLIADGQGNLYGTAQSNAPSTLQPCGIVFKLTPVGPEYSIGTFSVCNAQNLGNLVQDGLGNLYGTSGLGGIFGMGTVFEITTSGQSSILHSFGSGAADGTYPMSGLTLDQHGNLNGATFGGGTHGAGTIFLVTARHKETVTHSFNVSDGFYPHGGLIRDGQGDFYGTTENGGGYGAGEVFQLSPDDNETILYSFTGGIDGDSPQGILLGDASGNLYGVTISGGTHKYGTVFKITR